MLFSAESNQTLLFAVLLLTPVWSLIALLSPGRGRASLIEKEAAKLLPKVSLKMQREGDLAVSGKTLERKIAHEGSWKEDDCISFKPSKKCREESRNLRLRLLDFHSLIQIESSNAFATKAYIRLEDENIAEERQSGLPSLPARDTCFQQPPISAVPKPSSDRECGRRNAEGKSSSGLLAYNFKDGGRNISC